jgi:predicted TIM-barrel fold metal-dependent hydrolase
LAGLAGTAAAGVAGCCGIPVPEIEEGYQHKSLFLTPPVPSAATRLAFDTHAHFFNAHDVHVAGYLAHSIGHNADERLQELIKLIAPVIGRLTSVMTKSPRQEMEIVCRLSERFVGARQEEIDQFIDQEIDIHLQSLAGQLLGQLSGTRFEELYLEQARAVQPFGFESSAPRLTKQEILLGLYSGSSNDPAMTALRPSFLQGGDPRGVFSFARFMLSHRYHNLKTFQKHFAIERNGVAVAACMGSLVDFTYWLGCPGEVSSFQDQIMLHEKLAILSGGFLLPLVPYNPWTDIREDGASLGLVKRAVERHGCVGVKIYPPMGYYPYGNAVPPDIETPFERPDRHELDRKLLALYSYCVEAGVTVMAHSRKSMGRDGAHDELPSTRGWSELNKREEAAGLRVNLAHFGKENDLWAMEYARMMQNAGKITYYGDLGYWNDLRTNATAQGNWRALLPTQISSSEQLLDRIMYGSDWFMITMENRWGDYFVDFAEMMPSLSPESTAFERLFFRNAVECFGLSNTGQPGNRRRLDEFYGRNKVPTPIWMTYLDNTYSGS